MAQEYLTIKEAMVYTGRSESSIRRWIRALRNQFQIDLDHTNEQLQQTTPHLRKRNELEFNGTPRQDKHGLPVFDWLLLKTSLDEAFPLEGSQLPSDNLQPLHDDSPDHSPDRGQQNPADSPDTGQPKDGEVQKVKTAGADDEVQSPNDSSQASGQEDYVWMPKGMYEGLLEQLGAKDTQLGRKDGQLDELIERFREANVLLQGYQRHFGALPPPQTEPSTEQSDSN